jgi:hypothetical protein
VIFDAGAGFAQGHYRERLPQSAECATRRAAS